MFKKLFKLPLVAFVAIICTSCSNGKVAASLIPLDATMVMAIDIQSLAEKGELDKLGTMSSFKSLEREMRSENRELFNLLEDLKEDPSSAGIDLRDPIYIFTIPDGDDFYTAIAVHLLDDANFEVFMERILDDRSTPTYQKEDTGDFVNYRVRNGMNISFDGDRALFLMHNNKRNETLYGVRDNLMALENEETILEKKVFANFLDGQKDVSLYLSSNFITDNRMLMSELSNLPYDLSDNTVMAFLDFQDGKITLTAQVAYNEELKKLKNKNPLMGKKINEALLKYIRAESIAVGGIALNLENYLKLMDKSTTGRNEYSKINDIIDELDLKTIATKLDGSIVASYNGMEQRQVEVTSWYDEEPYFVTKSSPNLAVVVGIKDQAYFKEKISSLLEPDIIIEDGLQVLKADGVLMYMSYNKSSMMFTTNKEDALNHQRGTGANKSLQGSDIAKTMEDYPLFLSMDLNSKNVTQQFNNRELDRVSSSLKSWDKMMDRVEYKLDRDSNMALTLYMKNDDKNSLAQLITFVEQTYTEMGNL
jgi:hypothetical protein